MTWYKVVFDDGGVAYIDSNILENKTRGCHPQGLMNWLNHEVCRPWRSAEKIDAS